MKILISNDDGIEAPGIIALAKELSLIGEVTVVAPHRERSTAGHSLTLHKPLRIHDLGENRYSTSGTPADCIYLGVWEVLKGKPDIIVSGINTGANLGTDVYYSGTVAAAREGALMNIKSYAFSLVYSSKRDKVPEDLRFNMAAGYARKVIELTKDISFPSHTLLNVNIPNNDQKDIKGIAVARQGFRYYTPEVTRREDPRRKTYYWIGGAYFDFEKTEHCDCNAIDNGFVSVTPLSIDGTHDEFYEMLNQKGLTKS